MVEFNEPSVMKEIGNGQNNQIKSEYQFDSLEYKPHIVKQTAVPLEKIRLNKRYLNTILGILRIIIIV